jgi:protein gp37
MRWQKTKTGMGIEWTHTFHKYRGATANPIRGCEHDCQWKNEDGSISICYAKTMAERIQKMGVAYENGFETITFHPNELQEIRRKKDHAGIFIDSMSDLLGHNVPIEWQKQVMDTIKDCPQHIFYILTKNPKGFQRFDYFFPRNAWIGVSTPPTFMFGKHMTPEKQTRWFDVALSELAMVQTNIRWVSLEPLSWDCSDLIRKYGKILDWVIIGAATHQGKTFQPNPQTLGNVFHEAKDKGIPVFFKGNIDPKLAEDVCGGWFAEFPDEGYALRDTGIIRV